MPGAFVLGAFVLGAFVAVAVAVAFGLLAAVVLAVAVGFGEAVALGFVVGVGVAGALAPRGVTAGFTVSLVFWKRHPIHIPALPFSPEMPTVEYAQVPDDPSERKRAQ